MANLFYNTLPKILADELSQFKALGVGLKILTSAADVDDELTQIVNKGTIKWVVSNKGELVVTSKWFGTWEVAHTVLVEGNPVLAAGEADISSISSQFYGISINNFSGHYRPNIESLALGKAYFEKLGIRFLS